jgi:hypothetical protein
MPDRSVRLSSLYGIPISLCLIGVRLSFLYISMPDRSAPLLSLWYTYLSMPDRSAPLLSLCYTYLYAR